MNRRILFVDDEPNVLSGIRRMLRPQRNEWTTEFAESGADALATLAKAPYDVIVSDMRMPGMTGDQLLGEVRTRYPHMVRIILTGQCDKESGLRALRVAHRMLNKPCDPEELKLTVASTCALHNLLAAESIVAIVNRLDSLPSVPALYTKVVAELDSPEPSLDQVASLISGDIAMLTKILHVSNSALFGFRSQVSNARQAVALLGTETLRTLVLAVGLFSAFKSEDDRKAPHDTLWIHSQATSVVAKAIAKTETTDPILIENAAVAGLLHDVGKLVFQDCMPEKYREALRAEAPAEEFVWERERRLFGASHAEVGAYLLRLWGLPNPIVEAAAWHHRPSECQAPGFSPLVAVHCADLLTKEQEDHVEGTLDTAYLARLGLAERWPAWQALAEQSKA